MTVKTDLTMTNSKINEGLAFEEMKGLVDDVVSIDQYQPKIDDDEETVVVAFAVKYIKPAEDLNDFIQSSAIEHLDSEVSAGPDADGSYKVFVEFRRDKELFSKIEMLLRDITNITSKEGSWEFTAYKLDDPRPFDEERFRRDVTMTPEEYKMKHNPSDADIVKERIEFLVKY